MKFRKKPVVIEAVRVRDVLAQGMFDWPDWLRDAENATTCIDGFRIITLEGAMNAGRDDWIIRGVKGELYPCKPDIFEQTYEAVP